MIQLTGRLRTVEELKKPERVNGVVEMAVSTFVSDSASKSLFALDKLLNHDLLEARCESVDRADYIVACSNQDGSNLCCR